MCPKGRQSNERSGHTTARFETLNQNRSPHGKTRLSHARSRRLQAAIQVYAMESAAPLGAAEQPALRSLHGAREGGAGNGGQPRQAA